MISEPVCFKVVAKKVEGFGCHPLTHAFSTSLRAPVEPRWQSLVDNLNKSKTPEDQHSAVDLRKRAREIVNDFVCKPVDDSRGGCGGCEGRRTMPSTQLGIVLSVIFSRSIRAHSKWTRMITHAAVMGNQPKACGTMRLPGN